MSSERCLWFLILHLCVACGSTRVAPQISSVPPAIEPLDCDPDSVELAKISLGELQKEIDKIVSVAREACAKKDEAREAIDAREKLETMASGVRSKIEEKRKSVTALSSNVKESLIAAESALDELGEIVRRVEVYARTAEEAKIFVDAGCSDSWTICITTNARPIHGERIPELNVDDRIVVKLFGDQTSDGFALTVNQRTSKDSLFKAEALSSAKTDLYKLQDEKALTVGSTTDYIDVEVYENGDSGAKKTGQVTLQVNHGRYYFSFNLLLPFVYRGQTTVQTIPLEGSDDRLLEEDEDWRIIPAFGVTLYSGRRKRRLSAFDGGFDARDMFGLQIGTSFDLRNPGDEVYFGGVIEPVTGISLGAGVALVNIVRLPPSLTNRTLARNGVPLETDTDRLPRFYFALGFSQDVVDAITTAATRLRSN
ncbi:MAG: hypothetical protein RMA76_23420 [Deltaproteobacteria bacterium]